MDYQLELFDIMTGKHTRTIKTDSLFQFIVRVNPQPMQYVMDSKFIQETCIGYNFGSLISVGIADLKHDVEAPPTSEDTAETKGDHQAYLDERNFRMFQEILDKCVQKGLRNRKMLNTNYKAVSICQVEGYTAQVKDAKG